MIRHSALTVAAATVLCAAAWLGVNIAGNYGGRLSGLFYTGSKRPLPAELAHTYRVRDEQGYDGQFYHLVAHDPLLRRGFLDYVDNSPLRWRRIGVPGLAALLTAGNDRAVDFVYVAIELGFLFLGVLWLSRYAQKLGRHALWGFAFLLIPAVAVSLDRMTIDLPLAALTVGFAWYSAASEDAGPGWPLYAILAAAPLVRETGMLLVVAWCLYAGLHAHWRATALGAACSLPALGWWTYVHSRTPVDGTIWLSRYPFSGLIDRTFGGLAAPTATLWLRAAAALEDVALAGIWLALILCIYLAWKRRWGVLELTAIVFAAFAAALGKLDIWSSAYATGRTMSPLLIVLGLLAFQGRGRIFALPLLLVLPRLALQYEAQLKGALHGG